MKLPISLVLAYLRASLAMLPSAMLATSRPQAEAVLGSLRLRDHVPIRR